MKGYDFGNKSSNSGLYIPVMRGKLCLFAFVKVISLYKQVIQHEFKTSFIPVPALVSAHLSPACFIFPETSNYPKKNLKIQTMNYRTNS